MGNLLTNGTDVVAFLEAQHREIESLFEQVLATDGDERASAFVRLRRLLAVHETAEEEIVHPAARDAIPDGEATVGARLAEEHEAKKTLAGLEELDVSSAAFVTGLTKLQKSVLTHASAEEREEFAQLSRQLDPQRLERMRAAAEFAESVAPTRPHPGVESRAANLLAGPFAAMIDRTRDALSGKS